MIDLKSTWDDKAPGPDGINNGALKFFEKWIKEDYHKGINSSFITLVPKVLDPIKITYFRPISLINCSFKILSKLLANRLEGLMGKLISGSE